MMNVNFSAIITEVIRYHYVNVCVYRLVLFFICTASPIDMTLIIIPATVIPVVLFLLAIVIYLSCRKSRRKPQQQYSHTKGLLMEKQTTTLTPTLKVTHHRIHLSLV